MAMQGKLVEQRPEEGTGEELYNQIQREKQKLIKEGKIKKQKPLPEITEDVVPFEIPESWKWVRLGRLISVISGVSYNKKDVLTSGIRILRGGNIKDMSVTYRDDDVFLPIDYYDDTKQIQYGDILIVASTGSTTVIGKTGFVSHNTNTNSTMIGAFLRIVRPINTSIALYLRVIFGTEYYRKHIRSLAQGTNINNIKEEYITSFIIPLPPLAEQKRIVAKIEEIMPFIDRYAVAYDHLQSYNTRFPDDLKKSILQMAIQGKLVPQDPNDEPASVLLEKIAKEKQKLVKEGKIKKQKPLPPIKEEEIPFEIPENWKWVRLGSLITDTDAGKSPQCENRPATNQEWGVIKTTAIQDGYFLPNENKVLPPEFQIKSDQVVHAGDLLITRAGPQNRTGITCIVNEEPVNLILSDKTVRIKYVKDYINEKYLMFALKSPAVMRCIMGAKSGMAESQVNISQNNMKLFVLPYPPLAEQKRIVARLDELLPQIDELK